LVISLDKKNPLAFHYLGRILYGQGRWEEADLIFNYALDYYLDSAAFERYTDSLGKRLPTSNSRDCIIKTFRFSHYIKIDDHYFLANLYEAWSHFAEAETHYRAIITSNPADMGGYYKLWRMLERTSRYKEAENVLRTFVSRDASLTGNHELNSF